MPFKSIGESPKNIRRLRPNKESEPVPLTLAQINWIANVADGIGNDNPDVGNPFAIAIANFKKSFEVRNGKWMRKKKVNSMCELNLFFQPKFSIVNSSDYIIPTGIS